MPRHRCRSRSPSVRSRQVLDYAATFGAEFFVLVAGLLTLRLAAHHWGVDGFGLYVLGRRSLALLQLPALCGMAIGLTRFLALNATNRGARTAYFRSALVIALAATSLCFALLRASSHAGAKLLFGDATQTPLLEALGVAVFGLVVHSLAYGAARGRLRMIVANALQVASLGLLPLAAFLIPGLSVRAMFLLLGGGWTVLGGCVLVAVHLTHRDSGDHDVCSAARTLLRFGVPRIPGELALGALGLLPVTLAAHAGGATAAGYLGIMTSLVTMVSSVFAPLGQLLLPQLAQLAGQDKVDGIRRQTRRAVGACVLLAVVLVVVLELVLRIAVVGYFGAKFLPAVPYARVGLIGAIPFTAYVVLRNVLDALEVRALNARNLLIAVAALLVVFAIRPQLSTVPYAYLTGCAVLGLASWRDARRVVMRGVAA